MNRKKFFAAVVGTALATVLGGVGTGLGEELVDGHLLGRLRVVEDPDGHANVRTEARSESAVSRKLASGSVVGVGEKEGEWIMVYDGSEDGSAEYMHSSRLKDIAGWTQVGGVEEKGAGMVKHRGMEVRVTAAPFVEADHEITELSEGFYEVDGGVAWGTDGNIPKRSLSLSVMMDGKAVAVPKEAVENLYEPNFDAMVLLTPGDPGERAPVLMMNSDGAGTYVAVWAFAGGRYVGRAVMVPD